MEENSTKRHCAIIILFQQVATVACFVSWLNTECKEKSPNIVI